jgi:hypothetical protein
LDYCWRFCDHWSLYRNDWWHRSKIIKIRR